MYNRILRQMREKIRTRQYVMTVHAEEEMTDDNLSVFDVERVILTGSIVERQKDQDTTEWKYLVEGETIAGELAVVVAKISITGKLVIITVYVE
jgi:arginyl-tRNA--protein-N-Asp/Glu arginylyltransferase